MCNVAVIFSYYQIIYNVKNKKWAEEGWEELKLYFKKAVKGKNAFPAAAIFIQNFGDFLGFNPQMHILISDGCFHENGTISISPDIDTAALEQIFRHMVFKDVFG